MTVQELARKCAEEMIAAAGPDPFDADGMCLISTEPMLGDWVCFNEVYEDLDDPEVTDVLAIVFEAEYREHAQTEIDRLVITKAWQRANQNE